ncbi:MAG: ribonuclease J [Clostridia bacterium]|nr:ribonuclease J [Clostridia bacterium]
MCAIEYGNDIVLIDAGIAFPDEEMPGVDLVIPDISYLTDNAARVRGILLTHGHEDHIGGVPYVLRELSVPVYGTALTMGILRHKLEEVRLPKKPDLRTVRAGDTVTLGALTAEFVHVNHSIPDASAIALRTPLGTVFHTGDYKLDVSPIGGRMMDLGRIAAIGDAGVLLMLGESTNAERVGYTPSERRVGNSLEQLFTKYPDRRLVVATFSSNVHRVQQIIDASVRHGRHVVVFGRSMMNVVGAATELGYIQAPEGTVIAPQEMKRYKPEQLTLLTTGSQGEPMSALYRMAFGAHDRVTLTSQDVVVLSSSAIPGNEKLIGKIINTLIASGIRVENDDSIEGIHVSGHACSEELKLMLALVRPQYFMPIHGEARHLFAHKEIAEFMGIAPDRIFLGENGRVLELDTLGARFSGNVPAGQVLIDGSGIGDVGTAVLRDRKLLSEDGLISVVATIDRHEGLVLSGPEIVSRGFVYVKEAESLMEELRAAAARTLEGMLDRGVFDFNEMKGGIREELSRLVFKKTKRRPMILPILLEL